MAASPIPAAGFRGQVSDPQPPHHVGFGADPAGGAASGGLSVTIFGRAMKADVAAEKFSQRMKVLVDSIASGVQDGV